MTTAPNEISNRLWGVAARVADGSRAKALTEARALVAALSDDSRPLPAAATAEYATQYCIATDK